MKAPPVLDTRDAAALVATLTAATPGYTPEWSPQAGGPAGALLHAYARFRDLLNQRLNQVPERHQAALLDLFGTALLRAQGARVPLVFAVAPEATRDVTLAQGSQVAASQPVPLPSLEPGAAPAVPAEPPLFATERTVTLTPGHLVSLVSLDPGSDRYADHSGQLADGFELFSDMQLTPRAIYLGHDTLFALGGSDITLIVGFALRQGAATALKLLWEYLTDGGWVPLPYALEEDTTGGLTDSGQVTLRRSCGPNAKKAAIAGHESFWIRARLASPLVAGMAAVQPIVNDVRVRVRFRKDGLLPEAGFADALVLDLTKHFHPFGQRPAEHACLYLASKEVFARPGARVRMVFEVSKEGKGNNLELAWEYLGAHGWRDLKASSSNGENPPDPFTFESNGTGSTGPESPSIYPTVGFTCPPDWVEAEVNGVSNHWLRARIEQGDFGKAAVYDPATLSFTAEFFEPPVLKRIALGFEYLTDPEPVQHALTHNDFCFTDVTQAARWPDRTFKPFTPVQDQAPAIHFGFNRPLPDGLGSLYAHCPAAGADTAEPSTWQWEYRTAQGWRELGLIDQTAGFQRSGMIQFIGPHDAVATDGLNGRLYRIRARLKRGESLAARPVAGLWLNAVWAVQQRTVERELLGRGDGNPGQRFNLNRNPVLEGECVEVEEWTGRGETWSLALAAVAPADLRLERDPVTGEALVAWVRWSERAYLHDSGPGERVYTLERATGTLRFGAHAPPAGRRVLASYRAGGGLGGNVPAGTVTQMRMAQPLIVAVTNPIAAAGGADVEPLARALVRGPQGLRHRGRALSAQDIEWLAREASPEVARARCLPLHGPAGLVQRGYYRVLIVPYSTETRPSPTEELARKVREYLARHAAATARIRVMGPRYLAVSVRAELVPLVAGEAALVEERVRSAVNRFLHPLMGGSDGDGWGFGQAVPRSRLAAVLGSVADLSHARDLVLAADGALCGDYALPGLDVLPCPGPHELVLKTPGACA